jgi:hypothetical protein
MVVTHGGYLWVEDLVSKDVDLIAFITGMPYRGEIHMQYLDEKTKEKALVEEMNNTYGTKREVAQNHHQAHQWHNNKAGYENYGVQVAQEELQGGIPCRAHRGCNKVRAGHYDQLSPVFIKLVP